MKLSTLTSPFDGLSLSVAITEPTDAPKAIIQISHGMAEHKERYFPFMEYLSNNGYVCVIHDHRGHGGSVKSNQDYGYFYTENICAIVDDLHAVTLMIKAQYPNLPLYLFSHSMGTLVARNYLKNYDNEICKVVLCGPPTENKAVNMGLYLAKHSSKRGKICPNQFLNNMAFKSFNKGYTTPNAWLSENPGNVLAYNADPLCGFVFTTNGFINLLTLQKEAFRADNWHPTNPKLPILVMAGQDDPVIISVNKFKELLSFLSKVGYGNIQSKLYENKRHEILNEANRYEIFEDVRHFFDK